MPHYRATVEGLEMDEVDRTLREARVGVVVGGDVESSATASGVPSEAPEVESVTVSVDAADPEEARRKLEEALADDASIEVLG